MNPDAAGDGRVARLDLGGVTVTVIRQAVARWTSHFTRGLDAVGAAPRSLSIGFNVVHVRGPTCNVLVDPGLDDPRSRWGLRYTERHPFTRFDATASEALASLGEDLRAVTHVAITHAHLDHLVGATVDHGDGLRPRFPHARHVLMRADRTQPRYDRDVLGPDLAERLACLEASRLLDLADGPAMLASGVAMCPAPGESPGHAVVEIEGSSGVCIVFGDLAHHGDEIRDAALMPGGRDPATLWRSRMHWYARAADRSARVVLAHSPRATFGRVERARGGGFLWHEDHDT